MSARGQAMQARANSFSKARNLVQTLPNWEECECNVCVDGIVRSEPILGGRHPATECSTCDGFGLFFRTKDNVQTYTHAQFRAKVGDSD